MSILLAINISPQCYLSKQVISRSVIGRKIIYYFSYSYNRLLRYLSYSIANLNYFIIIQTATSDAPSYHEYNQTVLLKVNNAEGRSNKKQRMLPFSWLSQQHLLYTSRNRNESREEIEEASVAAASPVASKSLPAIYSSAVEAAVVGRKNNVNILERSSSRNRVSPHFVLGAILYVNEIFITIELYSIFAFHFLRY